MPRKSAQAHRDYQKWYMQQPGKLEMHNARVQKYLAEAREIVSRAKAGGCIKCGEKHIGVLDFHHRNPAEKSFNIAAQATKPSRPDRLHAEIAKCDVLCCNCHRKLHWEEKNATNA